MRRLLAIVLILCLVAPVRPTSPAVVLVVRDDSPVTDLDSVTLRKLFLGLPVLVNGNQLRALRDRSDPQLDEIFLQQIVAMSQSSYDRQLLILMNRQRALRPPEFYGTPQLVAALSADPNAVSFMWLRDVGHNPKLRIIRVIWGE